MKQKSRRTNYDGSVVVSECSENYFALRATMLRKNTCKMNKEEKDVPIGKSLCHRKSMMVNTFITDKAGQVYKVVECIDANSFIIQKQKTGTAKFSFRKDCFDM